MAASVKYKDEILDEINELSDEQIANLMKIIRLFKESIIRQRESDFGLKQEFEEWDKLSDEAMLNFEGNFKFRNFNHGQERRRYHVHGFRIYAPLRYWGLSF